MATDTSASRHPTAQDNADYVANLSDQELFGIFSGRKALLEDPVSHQREIRDAFSLTESDKLRKVDLGKHLSDIIQKERPELVPQMADAMRMAAQMAPELVNAALNEVRRNFNMLPMVDTSLEQGPFIGRVTSQNNTQTIVTDAKGTKSFLLENSALSCVPSRNSHVRVERGGESGGFKVTTLSQAKESGQGLGR